MESYVQPIDKTLQVIERLFPPEKETTKFDKIVDLIKALSSGTIIGVVGQAIETTGKVCNAISAGQQRIQAVKYVKDAYEVKCRSEVELAKVRERQSRNQLMTLYVEKSFQLQMDNISKEIILRNHEIDTVHAQKMLQIRNNHEEAIRQMDNIAKEHLHKIDKKYSTIIRRNEMYCLAYRQYLKYLSDIKTSPGMMIAELSNRYMDIVEKAVLQSTTNIDVMTAGLDGALKLLQFLGDPDHFFITFDRFISQKKLIEGL